MELNEINKKDQLILDEYTNTFKTYQELSEQFNVSVAYIFRLIKENDLPSPSKKRELAVINYCKLRSYKVSKSELINAFDISYGSLSKILDNNSIELINTKDSVKKRLSKIDTTKLSLRELYDLCKDLSSNIRSFKQLLLTYNIKYKK